MIYTAGVDVGGTNIVCGLINAAGEVVIKAKDPTSADKGPQAIIQGIAERIRHLCAETGIGTDQLTVIGMGIPGLVDPVQGISLRAVNLQWTHVPVAEALRRILGIPVYIDNDVRMYVYGEAACGAGRGFNHVFGITIGTGLASAFVNHGQMYHGHRFIAGEIGHAPMDEIDSVCNCGNTGCLETVVSATGIARQARQRILNGESSLLRNWIPDTNQINAGDVSRACESGDRMSRDILSHTGRILGRALSWVVPVLSPDVIIIGGGGALAGDALVGPMQQELNRRLLRDYLGHFTVKYAELNDDAGIIGSGIWALRQFNERRGQ
ncbi:ROK family protein [Paenibacillus sp. sgz500958]|uniref:ROK family protein n=1 Tax=Paenibacillus sp. sgz500958 TaxID=3242475 RepID=UPI0036D42B6D